MIKIRAWAGKRIECSIDKAYIGKRQGNSHNCFITMRKQTESGCKKCNHFHVKGNIKISFEKFIVPLVFYVVKIMWTYNTKKRLEKIQAFIKSF
ncbi:hypothetical protein HW35_06580 [Bacillus sp. X1(2014)]|nr:hypothetical protein HW35_06580 [Bacillus sp. X1(2014)]